jgi:hypothetical protein
MIDFGINHVEPLGSIKLVIIRQIKEDTEIRNKENREINNVN